LVAVHIAVGIAVMATSLAAGAWGAWSWWRGELSPAFWPLLRASQVVLAIQVALGAVLVVLGHQPPRLHVLYGALPLAVSFVAEQLRLVSADQVLERRGLGSARDMERLPEEEQRAIVVDIVRREMGVMAASALVVFLLAVRASGVAGLFPV
jgi:hypothetical protein